jgi:transcriptional regulator with XRE-family HTH domain
MTQLDIATLIDAIDDERHARRMTWKKVAAEIGVAPTTMSRFKSQGDRPNTIVLASMLRWLEFDDETLGKLVNKIIR